MGYQDTSSCDVLRSFKNQIADQDLVFNTLPNPFNSSINIHFSLTESQIVDLLVYDIMGKLVSVIYRGYKYKGINKVHWDGKTKEGTELGSGIYFLTIVAKDLISTKKITLLE